jgi:hypothetical protein
VMVSGEIIEAVPYRLSQPIVQIVVHRGAGH